MGLQLVNQSRANGRVVKTMGRDLARCKGDMGGTVVLLVRGPDSGSRAYMIEGDGGSLIVILIVLQLCWENAAQLSRWVNQREARLIKFPNPRRVAWKQGLHICI